MTNFYIAPPSETFANGEIRAFDEAWLGRLVAVYQLVFGQSPAHREVFENHKVRHIIHEIADLWVATSDDQIIGFVGGTPLSDHCDGELRSLLGQREDLFEPDDVYFIDELGVLADFQGDGWGRRLFTHILNAAAQRGFRRVLLQTSLHPLNPPTGYYVRQGFEPLLDHRSMPIARIASQPRLDDRPREDIRLLMMKCLPAGDLAPKGPTDARAAFGQAVRRGLMKERNKSLPCAFIYDERGSRIFEQVCATPQYYVTRVELQIIAENAAALARLCGHRVAVLEMGSGSSIKTRLILDALINEGRDVCYVPIDISANALNEASHSLRGEYPGLKIEPIHANYETAMRLFDGSTYDTVLVLWLGTSVGNFVPHDAERILCQIRTQFATNGIFVLGIDLVKDRAVLEGAYNDSGGLTADFNLNLLVRINNELDGHFDLRGFEHLAFFNAAAGRIEMHIASRLAQTVAIDALGIEVAFAEGETIHTENSYKFAKEQIAELAWRCCFKLEHHWVDTERLFSVNVLRAIVPNGAS